VNKIILFSYQPQTFAACENGQVVRTGQQYGTEKKIKPASLFYRWKLEETTSTFNDGFKWNFNVLSN
jgi:hypothetical protein